MNNNFVVKTKLLEIPEEINKICEFPIPLCRKASKYYLRVHIKNKSMKFEDTQGMFLCELHKEPRITVDNDKVREELKVRMNWLTDYKQQIGQKWTRAEKKGTHQVGATVRL